MQNSLFFTLLNSLTTREKAGFLQFLQASGQGSRANLARLVTVYQENAPASKPSGKAALYPRVFGPEAPYDDARLRKILELGLRLLERYLVDERVDTQTPDYRLRLADVLIEKKQEKLLRRLLAAPLPLPAAEHDWTTAHFEQAARWYERLYQHRVASEREHDADLYERLVYCQTAAMLARRFYQACMARSNQKGKDRELPDAAVLSWAETYVPDSPYARLPLVQTLHAALQTLRKPTEPTFFAEFHRGLQDNRCFTHDERRALLLVAINHCSQRYNAGDRAYLDTQLDLYDHGLRDGLLLENGWLSGYTFTNIATLALIGRHLDRLDRLIVDYGGRIEPRGRPAAVAFNRARLCHARRQYGEALALLQQNVFNDDILLNLSAKTVQAKCFFELDEVDLLEAHLEALRRFIVRHHEIGYYGERYQNFIRALQRLMKAAPAERTTLAAEWRAAGVLAEKEWLLGVVSSS